jgi:site-specific DNA recombinase
MWTAIYARLSKDRAGESENIEIQKAECVEYAAEKGWEVVGPPFEDNDISASRYSTKPRPGYQALLESIRAGQVEAVLVTEMPRLYRRIEELLELLHLAETTPLRRIEPVEGNGYDLSTGEGVHNAVSAVNNAVLESRKISDRTKRKKKAQARNGVFSGGPRPFGYSWTPAVKDRAGKVLEPSRLQVVQREAEMIRQVANKLLGGKSLRSVTYELNQAGWRTIRGNYWRPSNLRRVLTSHRIVGVRVHHGVEYPATWPAILDRETWEELQLLLNAEARFTGAARKGGRTYLLTGMVFCGYCQQEGELGTIPMIGYGSRDKGGPARRRYYCKATDDRGLRSGCGKVARLAEPVEALVSDAVLEMLESERMAKLLADTTEPEELAGLLREHQEHKLRLEEVRAAYASGRLGMEDMLSIRAMIEEAMDGIRRRMAKLQSGRALASVPMGQSYRQAWDKGDLDWRRSLVALVVEKVILHPGRPGAHRWPDDDNLELLERTGRQWQFDPDKVEIRWRV